MIWQQEQQMREFYEPGFGHMEAWHWMHSTEPEEYNEEYDRCRPHAKLSAHPRSAASVSGRERALNGCAQLQRKSSQLSHSRHARTQVHAAAYGERGARSQLPRGTRTAAAAWRLGIPAGRTRARLLCISALEVAESSCAGGRDGLIPMFPHAGDGGGL